VLITTTRVGGSGIAVVPPKWTTVRGNSPSAAPDPNPSGTSRGAAGPDTFDAATVDDDPVRDPPDPLPAVWAAVDPTVESVTVVAGWDPSAAPDDDAGELQAASTIRMATDPTVAIRNRVARAEPPGRADLSCCGLRRVAGMIQINSTCSLRIR
jgi:hypothetical protein